MTSRRIVHVVIRGRVQGVGFRAWAHHQAELRGLEGWVRNRKDGSVEAVFAGSPDITEAMLGACRKGPGGSRVESADVQERTEASLGEAIRPGRFEVLRTV